MAALELLGKTAARLYDSGEFSDLTISTATKNFRVHKNIVCACPFFRAACTRDFKEAHTGVVNLPESEDAVEGLLRHLYGLPIKEEGSMLDERVYYGKYLVQVYIAADKYDLPSLRVSASTSMMYFIEIRIGPPLVAFGKFLFDQEDGLIEPWLLKMAVTETAAYITSRSEGYEEARRELCANPAYIGAVFDQIGKVQEWRKVQDQLNKKRQALIAAKQGELNKS